MDIRELARQIEYKVAPEPLIAVQGLANTIASEPEEERLLDPGSARRWMIESGLATRSVEVGEPELAGLVEAREVLRDLIEVNLTGKRPRDLDARLGALARSHPVELAPTSGGDLDLDLEPAATVDELISQMLGIVYRAQAESKWERLKICASDECRWAFYDRSKNRGGTWCQMETCGNLINNRAYRSRRAGAAR